MHDEKPYFMIWLLVLFVVITLIAILVGLARNSTAAEVDMMKAPIEVADAYKANVSEAAKY